MKPLLLILVHLAQPSLDQVAQHFDVLYGPISGLAGDRSGGAPHIAAHGAAIRIVLTNGVIGLLPQEIDALPQLGLVCTLGVGHENVALGHASARGVRVCNAAGTNASCVADHAMALLLSALRRIPALNRQVREGVWRDAVASPPHVSGRKLGIVGLGAIGRGIARRAEGFDMDIGYHGRTQQNGVPFRYFQSTLTLATWADILVIATPGGAQTRHIVDAAVLQALGPEGVLVNISRGSTVDTAALADALRRQLIGAAALDVYDSEPLPPPTLVDFDNVVLTPHVGGMSPVATQASVQRFIDNATAFVAGRPLLSPIN